MNFVLSLFVMWSKVLQYQDLIRFLCQFRGQSDTDFDRGVCDFKGFYGWCGFLGFLNKSNSDSPTMEKLVKNKEVMAEDVSNDDELHDGDNVFDETKLKKLMEMERNRANAVQLELEKERMAIAEAAEEAMAMILRLQNERSLVEMEARQYRRMAEEKQLHDQEVIQSLRWMVMEHESQRIVLEDELRLCRQKLHIETDEQVDINLTSFSPMTENGLEDVLISSLDMDSHLL